MVCFSSCFHCRSRPSNLLALMYFICHRKLFIATMVGNLVASVFCGTKLKISTALYSIIVTAQNYLICWTEAHFQIHFQYCKKYIMTFKTTRKVPKHAFNVSVAIWCSPSLANLSMVSIKQVIWFVCPCKVMTLRSFPKENVLIHFMIHLGSSDTAFSLLFEMKQFVLMQTSFSFSSRFSNCGLYL